MSLAMILHFCRLQNTLNESGWLVFVFSFSLEIANTLKWMEINWKRMKIRKFFPCWMQFVRRARIGSADTNSHMNLWNCVDLFLFLKKYFCFAFRSALVFQSFYGPKRVPMQWQRIYLNSSNSTKRSWLILIYDTISIIQKHCHSLQLRILSTE